MTTAVRINLMCRPLFFILSLSFLVSSSYAEDIRTRFATLAIDDEQMLVYKNQPLSPEIKGNNSLSVLEIYQVGNSDVVLLRDSGGSACPARFYFVTTSASGVKSSSAFGTCTDEIDVKPTFDSIIVTMSGFKGPFESKAAQKKSAKERNVYVFKGGVLTENGKTVK